MYKAYDNRDSQVAVYATTGGVSYADAEYLAADEEECVIFVGRDGEDALHAALFYTGEPRGYAAKFPENQDTYAANYYYPVSADGDPVGNTVVATMLHPCLRHEAVQWLKTGEAECLPF